MVSSPFGLFFSAFMIAVFFPVCKCTGLSFFCPIQRPDGHFDLPEHHFCNVAGGDTKNRYGSACVKVQHMGEVTVIVVLRCIYTTSGQQHVGNAVDQGKVKAAFQIIAVQLIQKTSCFDPFQGGNIVLQIIRDGVIRDLHQEPGEVKLLRHFAKAVFQSFPNCLLVLVRHLPEVDLPTLPAVGIGHIENIAQLVGNIPVNQQGDALGAFVDPSSKFIPHLDLRTGSGIGFLGMDQQLLLKAVLVVICGGVQERHEPFGVGGYAQGLLRRHFFDNLILTGHFTPPYLRMPLYGLA